MHPHDNVLATKYTELLKQPHSNALATTQNTINNVKATPWQPSKNIYCFTVTSTTLPKPIVFQKQTFFKLSFNRALFSLDLYRSFFITLSQHADNIVIYSANAFVNQYRKITSEAVEQDTEQADHVARGLFEKFRFTAGPGFCQDAFVCSWLDLNAEKKEKKARETRAFSLLSSSLSAFCRWHGVDSTWFNCQATVWCSTWFWQPQVSPLRSYQRAKMNHRAMRSYCTHTNTHTPLQICQGQSLPPNPLRNFNMLVVTRDSSTLALCPFTAHLRQAGMSKWFTRF